MPNLTVRDIPHRVYDRLRERAARNRRSMSGEIVTLLEQSLLPERIDTEALIAEAEAFHDRLPEPLPDLVAEGKRAGRKYEDEFSEKEGGENEGAEDDLAEDDLADRETNR